ncbi:hypothetical protein GE21DRAFT_1268958 [Neurospora crassa]|nr:hypothetical protein GE21DRAFT_1268958 [Neurospora crassa]
MQQNKTSYLEDINAFVHVLQLRCHEIGVSETCDMEISPSKRKYHVVRCKSVQPHRHRQDIEASSEFTYHKLKMHENINEKSQKQSVAGAQVEVEARTFAVLPRNRVHQALLNEHGSLIWRSSNLARNDKSKYRQFVAQRLKSSEVQAPPQVGYPGYKYASCFQPGNLRGAAVRLALLPAEGYLRYPYPL